MPPGLRRADTPGEPGSALPVIRSQVPAAELTLNARDSRSSSHVNRELEDSVQRAGEILYSYADSLSITMVSPSARP